MSSRSRSAEELLVHRTQCLIFLNFFSLSSHSPLSDPLQVDINSCNWTLKYPGTHKLASVLVFLSSPLPHCDIDSLSDN